MAFGRPNLKTIGAAPEQQQPLGEILARAEAPTEEEQRLKEMATAAHQPVIAGINEMRSRLDMIEDLENMHLQDVLTFIQDFFDAKQRTAMGLVGQCLGIDRRADEMRAFMERRPAPGAPVPQQPQQSEQPQQETP